MGAREKPVFVEVKFRTDPESLEEELLLEKEALEKFWEAKIVLVTIKENRISGCSLRLIFQKKNAKAGPFRFPTGNRSKRSRSRLRRQNSKKIRRIVENALWKTITRNIVQKK